MTSPNTGLRRGALAALAVGAAIGMSACSAGQISQTASQVAAVDGGQGSAGDIYVNDLLVALPESGEGEAKVGFVASYTDSGKSDSVSIDQLEIDGTEVQLGESKPIGRGCSLVFSAAEDSAQAPLPKDVCIENSTATMPVGDLSLGTSVPATVSFSNGDKIETNAGVIAEITVAGEYDRPSASATPSEGH